MSALQMVHDSEDEDEDASPWSTTVVAGGEKGKSRMTDEELALSLFAEDALANFSEYNEEYGGLNGGQIWNEGLNVLDGFRGVQTLEQARHDLEFALALLGKDKELGAAIPEESSTDALATSSTTEDILVVGPGGQERPQNIASLLLTYRELSNAGLINAGALPPEVSRDDCGVCGEKITGRVIKLDCGHVYDLECTLGMFSANANDEMRFPPRCCGDPMPLALITDDLSDETRAEYEAKIVEYSTPQRLYCSNKQCAKFLGPREFQAYAKACEACSTTTCAGCNEPAHEARVKCKIDKGLKKALVLGQSRGWQRCPGCRQLVERNDGCYHMSCRCGYQFCYLCAAQWKTCSCSGGTSTFMRIFSFRKVRIRGNYLLETEYGARHDGPLKRLWKGTVGSVGRNSRSTGSH